MAGFINNFDISGPEGSDLAKNIDTFIREDTKSALDERYELEHFSLADGVNDPTSEEAQGRHKAGLVGCIGYGTLADRQALLFPGNGALFQCTEEDPDGPYPAGTIYRYEKPGDGWTPSQISLAGTIFASDEEAFSGVVADKAISPRQFKATLPRMRLRQQSTSDGAPVPDATYRKFNTVDNTIVGATTASPYFTLPKGEYEMEVNVVTGTQSTGNPGWLTTQVYPINIDLGNTQIGYSSPTLTIGNEGATLARGGGIISYKTPLIITEPTTQIGIRQFVGYHNVTWAEGWAIGGGYINCYLDITITQLKD